MTEPKKKKKTTELQVKGSIYVAVALEYIELVK